MSDYELLGETTWEDMVKMKDEQIENMYQDLKKCRAMLVECNKFMHKKSDWAWDEMASQIEQVLEQTR